MDLAVRDLTYAFDADEGVLGPVSISVPAGSSIALTGPSGSGKSTLLHMLAGIVAPDSGTIRIGDVDLWNLSERDRTRFRLQSVGLVFQFAELVPELTMAENVGLPLWLLRRKGQAAAVESAMEELGIAHLGAKLPSQVSGGQRQRAAIARALIHEPGVVLADEPTGALDARTGEQAMSAMLQACGSRGCTLIVATHDPAVAAGLDGVLDLGERERHR